jgi:hypothetical protein
VCAGSELVEARADRRHQVPMVVESPPAEGELLRAYNRRQHPNEPASQANGVDIEFPPPGWPRLAAVRAGREIAG